MDSEKTIVVEPPEKIREERDQLHSVVHEFVDEVRKLREENERLKRQISDLTAGSD